MYAIERTFWSSTQPNTIPMFEQELSLKLFRQLKSQRISLKDKRVKHVLNEITCHY